MLCMTIDVAETGRHASARSDAARATRRVLASWLGSLGCECVLRTWYVKTPGRMERTELVLEPSARRASTQLAFAPCDHGDLPARPTVAARSPDAPRTVLLPICATAGRCRDAAQNIDACLSLDGAVGADGADCCYSAPDTDTHFFPFLPEALAPTRARGQGSRGRGESSMGADFSFGIGHGSRFAWDSGRNDLLALCHRGRSFFLARPSCARESSRFNLWTPCLLNTGLGALCPRPSSDEEQGRRRYRALTW